MSGPVNSGRLSPRRGLRAGVVAGAVVALLAGCGGSGGPPVRQPAASSVGPSSVGSAPGGGAVNPNTPEAVAPGDIPDNQVFVGFTDPGGLFSVSVPQGWARSAVGSSTVFSDKFNGVRIESQPEPAAPDVGSAMTREVPALRASTPGFTPGTVSAVQRPAGQAVVITYEAASAPNPVTGRTITEAVQRYEFWHSGEQLTLTLSGAKGADNVDPWKMITDSVRWLR